MAEKAQEGNTRGYEAGSSQLKRSRLRLYPRLIALAGLLLYAVFWLRDALPADLGSDDAIKSGEHYGTHTDEWDAIVPSWGLAYTPCFSSFQCARLRVPLNWNASSDDADSSMSRQEAIIAIIKLPALVPVTDPSYGGTVVVNPGGPGESGVFQVLSDGKNLQTLLDSPDDNGLHFDILSFDPRGVNNTRPALRCFDDALQQRDWLVSSPDYGLLWSSPSVIGMEWARSTALGRSCSTREGSEGILQYANTAQVVEDIVHIVDKEGEWRMNEGERRLSLQIEKDAVGPHDEVRKRLEHRPGEEKVRYWGMSYGTIVGSTLAAMHPDQIERMVLDGVVDPADHYAGAWATQLQDSDLIVSMLCEYCFQAGSACPLFLETSASGIEARFTSILNSLKQEPVGVTQTVISGGGTGPAVITYGDAHLQLLTAMYFPFAFAEAFFETLLALEQRNATSPILQGIVSRKQQATSINSCDFDKVPYVSGMGAFQAISCMDTGNEDVPSRDSFDEYLSVALNESQWIGPSWARNKLACLGFSVQPAWRPAISFEKQEWDNTSHPLLIVGNTHDTVTPLRNARRVSTLFPGSTVLQQDSQGHCSHSMPSFCTAKAIREYFQTGSLPEDGTVCRPEILPFLGCSVQGKPGQSGCEFADEEDEKLWEALVDLADPFGLRDD